ncbi:hypothetical protein VTN96DRAFT_3165 [Rasamsonia emersonii]
MIAGGNFASGLLSPFLGALQACISVLLTLCYGVVARKAQLIREGSINDLSGLCVKVFLPALIIINLGSQLHLGSVLNYVPVLIWSILYASLSVVLAHIVTKLLKLPPWVTPACAFNNTTSLPLLLLHSLKSTGSLDIITPEGQSTQEAIDRAQSYFLVCAVTTKTISYAVGPRMLRDIEDEDQRDQGQDERRDEGRDGEQQQQQPPQRRPTEEEIDEQTSLLPGPAQKLRHQVGSPIKRAARYVYSFFPERVKQELTSVDTGFVDVAMVCTITGVILGLVPKLHRAFFNPNDEGGIFNAWLTSSIENLGKLFTSLQIFMVGCKLGVSFERMKRSKNSGKVPARAILTVFIIRLIIWPVISISVIYSLALKTQLLRDDPMLWFTMMVMPAGPPALIISGLAELGKVSDIEKMAISKVLAIMYALSPFICFTITGALKCSEAVLKSKS